MLPLTWLLSKQPIMTQVTSSDFWVHPWSFPPLHACMLIGFSCVRLFATPRATACQDPLSMGFSRWEYWNGLSCPPPGDLPNLRDQTHLPFVSCTGKQIIYHWATVEVLLFFRSQIFTERQHVPGTMLGGPWKGAVTKVLDLTELIVLNVLHSHWCC